VKPILVNGPIGFEFTGYDRLDGSLNYKGLYRVRLLLDSTEIFAYRMDRLSYLETHLYPTFLDIRYLRDYNSWLQKCYIEQGNTQGFYDTYLNKGRIELTDDQPHRLTLLCEDYHGNQARFVCTLQRDTARPVTTSLPGKTPQRYKSHEVSRGHLWVRATLPGPDENGQINLYHAGYQRLHQPSYLTATEAHYLIPLRPADMPRSLRVGGGAEVPLYLQEVLAPGSSRSFIGPAGSKLTFHATTLFDSVFLYLKDFPAPEGACSPMVSVGDVYQPLKGRYDLYLPANERAKAFLPRQLVVCEVRGKSFLPLPTARQTASPGRFGNFCLVGDSAAPVLKPLFLKDIRSRDPLRWLSLTVTDNLSGVDPLSVQAYYDGLWHPVEYYGYGGRIFFRFPGPVSPGDHLLEIRLQDRAGNVRRQTFPFRYTAL